MRWRSHTMKSPMRAASCERCAMQCAQTCCSAAADSMSHSVSATLDRVASVQAIPRGETHLEDALPDEPVREGLAAQVAAQRRQLRKHDLCTHTRFSGCCTRPSYPTYRACICRDLTLGFVSIEQQLESMQQAGVGYLKSRRPERLCK